MEQAAVGVETRVSEVRPMPLDAGRNFKNSKKINKTRIEVKIVEHVLTKDEDVDEDEKSSFS